MHEDENGWQGGHPANRENRNHFTDIVTIAAAADSLEALLALSDERALWQRRLCQAERAAYQRGRSDGYRAGYEHGARLMEAGWPDVIAPLRAPLHAELELLRWGPGGRERFGDPRPGDRMPRRREGAA